jgi:hypothetical protein
MFADYISDSSVFDNSWANRSHRGWTALVSFAAQALAIADCWLCRSSTHKQCRGWRCWDR